MTPRDKELANEFIRLTKTAQASELGKTWDGHSRFMSAYDGGDIAFSCHIGTFQYQESSLLAYKGIYLDLSWWMSFRVHRAARRLTTYAHTLRAAKQEVQRRERIAS